MSERDSVDVVTLSYVDMECVPECWYSEGIVVGVAVDTGNVLAGVFELDRVTEETEGMFDTDEISSSEREDEKDDMFSEYDIVLEAMEDALGKLVKAVEEDLDSEDNEL